MSRDHKTEEEEKQTDEHEEPSLEDFLDEEDSETKEAEIIRKKRRQRIIRFIAISVSLFLVVNVLSIWLNLFNLDSIQLNRESRELSEEAFIQESKDAVVTIQTNQSRGTGFSISANGLIVTNHHVVEGVGPLIITFPSGQKFVGEIVDSDERIDIAIVNIDGTDLPYLPLSTTETVVNETIYVIGNPLLQTQIVNKGTILEKANSYDVIKISAPIFRGHSGSPVLTEQGEVVAVVYAKTVPAIFSDDESAGLAVPIHLVIEKLDTLGEDY